MFSEGDSEVVTAQSLISRTTTLRPAWMGGRETASSFAPLPGIRLVSQETSAPPPPGGETPMPILSQQPVFQNAGGGAYSGASTTDGTWALIAPYGWISGINGSLATPLGVLNVDFTPADVLDKLGDVNGAFMLHTEVGRGDIGLILDANIIRLTPQLRTVPALINLDMQQTLLEFMGMKRILEAPDFIVEGKTMTVDLLAGGRYYQFTNGFSVIPLIPPPFPIPAFERTETWVDMVVGARTRVPLTETLDGFFRVDFGGFGVGSSSSLAWNLIAGVDYKWSENTTIAAGYRQLSIDKFSGVGPAASGFDVTLYGPFAALTLQF